MTMSTMSERAEQQAEVSAEKTRAFALPIAAAILLFAAIVYIQFSGVLGQYALFAQFPLGVAFYACYAWHTSLVQKANVHAEKLKRG
ncbi:MAG: hypothetical protein JWM91_4663 [Rhodospirillales bacterium]|nr:hypothetical protein [Rhodospirillales bacterium]